MEGRPWAFILVVLLASWVCNFFAPLTSIFFIWDILYRVFRTFGFQKGECYVNMLLLGVVFCSLTVASNVQPFDVAPFICRGTLAAISGITISFEQWFAFSIPTNFVLILAYWLIMRYIFRIDLSRMKNISSDMVDKNPLILTKNRRISLAFTCLFIVLCISAGMLPSLLPEWAVSQFFARIGLSSATIIITLILLLVRVEGKPLPASKPPSLALTGIRCCSLPSASPFPPSSAAIIPASRP